MEWDGKGELLQDFRMERSDGKYTWYELSVTLPGDQEAYLFRFRENTRERAEIERLQTFEDAQVDFDRIRTEFYNEVVYAENGPGAEEYQKYYETMDPTTAEYLYKQVVQQLEEDKEAKEYAQTYVDMKPKQAAAIFEAMTDDLDLVARILSQMSTSDRGNILGAMDSEIAAKITRMMDPES